MDAVTIGAVLLAIISGASEELSSLLWQGVISLVRRPFHRKAVGGSDAATTTMAPTGADELAALERAPADEQKAVALAEVLLGRARADEEFRLALEAWWEQAEPVRADSGNVTNTISGGTQQGPVLQGRDFRNLTFGAASAAPPGPRSRDQGT